MIKVAILEASHWHVPLYLAALKEEGIKVVAVSDAELAKGPDIAKRFSARFYQNYEDLLQTEIIDFAFSFGRHCDMTKMAKNLIERNIAFSIEKPGGLNAQDVSLIQSLASKKNLFVAIPFILRFSELLQNLEQLNKPSPVSWQHMSFRFIAGPLDRYLNANCSWMLDKKLAGGGCTINLAVHFVDLALQITKEKIVSVSAQMIEGSSSADVEIFSRITLMTESGKVCGIETGYTYPGNAAEQREFSFTMASDQHYIHSDGDALQVVPRDGSVQQDLNIELNTDVYYAVFTRKTLEQFRNGGKPVADLSNLQQVMVVIDGAYASG